MYNYTKISCGESNLFYKISSMYENPRKKLLLNKTKSLFKLNDNVFIWKQCLLWSWMGLISENRSLFCFKLPSGLKFLQFQNSNKILTLISFYFFSPMPRLSKPKIQITWKQITYINILIFLNCRWNLETQFWTTTTSKHMEIYGISPIKKKKRTSEPAGR